MADAIVLYDEDCGFCRWALAKVLAWDRRIALRPLPLQGPDAERLLAGMPRAERIASWHLVADDGRVSSGGAALEPLFDRLPGGRPLAALAGRLPGAAERGYRLVADHRSAFGRLVSSGARQRADARIASRSRPAGFSANGRS